MIYSQSATVTVTYDVDAAVEPVDPLTNTANADDGDGHTAMGSDDLAITENIVLGLTKTFSPTSVAAGTSGHTFDIVVQNPGPLASPEWGNGASNKAHLIVNFKY